MNIPFNDKAIASLRAAYKKALLSNLGVAVFAALVGVLLLGEHILALSPLWAGVAVGVALLMAMGEYALERIVYKRGSSDLWRVLLLVGALFLSLIVAVILTELKLIDRTASFLSVTVVGFLLIRPLIPTVGLLRDYGRLKENDLCETVGRMKKNTRREESAAGRETYLLFEDELTHETHLLRMGSLSPRHRYRVFYLPHSGLAAGEPISDDTVFDPFGNPIETADRTEEAHTNRPAYTEEDPPIGQSARAAENNSVDKSDSTPSVETCGETFGDDDHRRPLPDPHSPERQKAAKLAVYRKVCRILSYVFVAIVLLRAVLSEIAEMSILFILAILPLLAVTLLGSYFQNKELKLRCTVRTTAVCLYTVRRRSGKHSHLHPVVEYEVDGVAHTAELSVSCSRSSVGELYTIYYDSLAPDTVRVG